VEPIRRLHPDGPGPLHPGALTGVRLELSRTTPNRTAGDALVLPAPWEEPENADYPKDPVVP
jgi:hypothetical protein